MTAVTPLRCNVCLEDISRNNPAYRLEHISLGNAVCEQANVFDSKCIIQLQQCPMCRHVPIQAYKAGVLGKLQGRLEHIFKTYKPELTGDFVAGPLLMVGMQRLTRVVVRPLLGAGVGSFAGGSVAALLGGYIGFMQIMSPCLTFGLPDYKKIAKAQRDYGCSSGIGLAITACTVGFDSEAVVGAGLLATAALTNIVSSYYTGKKESHINQRSWFHS